MNGSLDRRVVAVTGAARGLGLRMVRRFAADGSVVVVMDVDRAAGSAAVDALRRGGATATFAELDIRDPKQVGAVIRDTVSEHGRIDVWVNNANGARLGPAESLSRADWEETLALTLSGAFFCSQAVGREMLARGSGVIINVASVYGYHPIEGRAAQSVAMAGLIMLTQALGIEWAARGVRVVGVAPGMVNPANATAKVDERRTPMRRVGRLDEVAEAVVFLSNSEASYIIAETIRVDGGWTAYQLF